MTEEIAAEMADREVTLLELQLRCALADLIGSYQAYKQGDLNAHDWKSHLLSIQDVSNALDMPVPEDL
jgi:hypothetical protein